MLKTVPLDSRENILRVFVGECETERGWLDAPQNGSRRCPCALSCDNESVFALDFRLEHAEMELLDGIAEVRVVHEGSREVVHAGEGDDAMNGAVQKGLEVVSDLLAYEEDVWTERNAMQCCESHPGNEADAPCAHLDARRRRIHPRA